MLPSSQRPFSQGDHCAASSSSSSTPREILLWCRFAGDGGKPAKFSRDDDGDEDFDDDDDDGDDDAGFDPGAVASRSPRMQEVELLYTLQGHLRNPVLRTRKFPWTFSWLRVKIGITGPANRVPDRIQSDQFRVYEYALDDDKQSPVAAVSRFLNSLLETKDQHFSCQVSDFCDFVKLQPDAELTNLMALFSRYEEERGVPQNVNYARQGAVDMFRTLRARTTAGRVLELSADYPHFFRLSALLFPKKVTSMTQVDAKAEEDPKSAEAQRQRNRRIWHGLEEFAREEPWKLGFAELTFAATKCPGLEAPLYLIRRSHFYRDLEAREKDALHVYDTIKELCRRDGHTYVFKDDVERNYDFYKDRNYHGHDLTTGLYEILSYLEDLEVLVRDVGVGDHRERFHLSKFWRAEEAVETALQQLHKRQNKWEVQLDYESDRFSRVRADARQMSAVRRIASCPVVVVSGRGGTGKTEVVTSALEEIEFMEEQEEKRMKEDMEAEVKKEFGDQMGKEWLSEDESFGDVKKEKFPDSKSTAWVSEDESFSIQDKSEDTQGNDGGKTEEDEKRKIVLYTAPTGKAASVIRRRIKKEAHTIHRILASYRAWKNKNSGFAWKFASTKILAVDESSMVSLQLFSMLLKTLLRASQLKKVVLLGDRLQLPSIDPGNLMSDLCVALASKECVVELNTNHRSDGHLIFQNASLISERKMPTFDKENGFHLVLTDVDERLSIPRHVRPSVETLRRVTRRAQRIFDKGPPASWQMRLNSKSRMPTLSPEKAEAYYSLLWENRPRFDIQDHETSQIIAFTRAECRYLNELCCLVYNRHGVMEFDENRRRYKTVFANNDKIMATKNKDVPVYCPDEEVVEVKQDVPPDDVKTAKGMRVKQERLMNGSVYVIKRTPVQFKVELTHDPDAAASEEGGADTTVAATQPVRYQSDIEYYELDDLNNEITRPDKKAFLRQCKPCHAWALTIHKFQGSETDTVVYGVSDSKNETWQHVYTAVTRGKKRVVIVGKYKDLQAAVARRPRKRQTSLAERLQKMFCKMKREEEDARLKKEEEAFEAMDSFEVMASQMTEEEMKDPNRVKWESRDDSGGSDNFDRIASQLTDAQLRGEAMAESEEDLFSEDDFVTPKKRLKPNNTGVTPVVKGLQERLVFK